MQATSASHSASPDQGKSHLFLWATLRSVSNDQMVPCSFLPPGWESGPAPLPRLPIPARNDISQLRRAREVHEKLTGSLLTWGVARTETHTIPRKVLFLVFLTEMTADRFTWETSCICPPFTETGVTRAERAPVSHTMSRGSKET